MLPTDITYLCVEGLHGLFRYEVNFNAGLTILYGSNGSGKTTLLHIIANLVEADLVRFCHISFDSITVRTASGDRIVLEQASDETGEDYVHVMVNGERAGIVTDSEGTPPHIAALLPRHLGGLPVYLPAFRSVLEAITRDRIEHQRLMQGDNRQAEAETIQRRESHRLRRQGPEGRTLLMNPSWRRHTRNMAFKTLLCRDWFGQFVPVMRCPSLWEIADRIAEEVNAARLKVAEGDTAALSKVFTDVIAAVLQDDHAPGSSNTSAILERILVLVDGHARAGLHIPEEYQSLFDMLAAQNGSLAIESPFIRRVLLVYEQALFSRFSAEQEAYEQIRTFEGSVNRLIAPKSLDMYPPAGSTAVRNLPKIALGDGRRTGFSVLSSGERHILTLLFSATHMTTSDGIVLVDEPELSLHVDWQRSILTELMRQAGDRQIIVCTHAPEIAADHHEAMVPLFPEFWSPPSTDEYDEYLDDIMESE